MSDMSDLELVAQAMAPTETQTQKKPNKSDQTANSQAAPPQSVTDETQIDESSSLPDLSQIPGLSDLDPALLANLSLEDRHALLPLIQALQRSGGELDGDPGEGDGDEADMAEILRQMDAAGEVADDLEGKLDRLIQALGEEEKGLEGDTGGAVLEQQADEKGSVDEARKP